MTYVAVFDHVKKQNCEFSGCQYKIVRYKARDEI